MCFLQKYEKEKRYIIHEKISMILAELFVLFSHQCVIILLLILFFILST